MKMAILLLSNFCVLEWAKSGGLMEAEQDPSDPGYSEAPISPISFSCLET